MSTIYPALQKLGGGDHDVAEEKNEGDQRNERMGMEEFQVQPRHAASLIVFHSLITCQEVAKEP